VPANPAESRFGVGRGPIEDAFGSPALIVEGTLGTADEHAVVHAVVNELCSEWREAYFVDCPIKRDVDSTDADIQNYNLVIVGDGGTNSVIKRISDRLPVRSSLGHLSLAGKTYNGAQLGYEFIARNPLNTRKYVVIIGMNRWLPIKGWELYPTRDGVYDYIVFDLHGTSSRVEDEGYFETF
jgi:hypothetical protein